MAKRHVVELTDDERAALGQQEAGPLAHLYPQDPQR
jgi:hypothetical protein